MPQQPSSTAPTKRANRVPSGLLCSGKSRVVTHTFSGKLTPVTEPSKDASRLVHGTEDGRLLAGPKSPTKDINDLTPPDINKPSTFPLIEGVEEKPLKLPNNVPDFNLKVDVKDTKAFPALAGSSQKTMQPSFPTLRIVNTAKHPGIAALKRSK